MVIEIGCVRQNTGFQLVPNLACHFLLYCCAHEERVRRVAHMFERFTDPFQGRSCCFPVFVRTGWVYSTLQLSERKVRTSHQILGGVYCPRIPIKQTEVHIVLYQRNSQIVDQGATLAVDLPTQSSQRELDA